MLSRLILAASMVASLAACDYVPSADEAQRKAQEQLNQQSNNEVGMPAITNFQEKRTYKEILELRDTAISTTTYIQDIAGRLHKLCDSIGFGIPYATQYTNPQRPQWSGNAVTTLPQADPNGLFSPGSAEGTWILCLNPQTQKSAPLYVEPPVVVSPFPLQTQN